MNQTIRWFAGFFQNALKHFHSLPRGVKAVTFLLNAESTVFSILLDVLLVYALMMGYFLPFIPTLLTETIPWGLVSLYAIVRRKGWDLIKSTLLMPLIRVIDLHLWFYTMIKELLLRRKETRWRRADRIYLKRGRRVRGLRELNSYYAI